MLTYFLHAFGKWKADSQQASSCFTNFANKGDHTTSTSTMQTPKEWDIESLLGELAESSDRDNMADSDTVEYAISTSEIHTLKPRNLFADMTPPPDESAPAYSKEVANAEGESAFVGTVNGNHDYPHFKQETSRFGARSDSSEGKQDTNLYLHQSQLNEHDRLIEEKTRLLVANFSSSQLDRFECYRRSSFPRRKTRKVYAALCPQILLLYVCDICDGLWAVHYLQEEGGEWKATGFGRFAFRLLVANFSSSQLDRFECYRRSSFPRRKIRKFAFRLLVANFSSSQLDRFECYRCSSFPRRKIRKVYAALCPQILLLYVCDIYDGPWAVHYLQEEGGEWKATGFGRLIHRFTRQTPSDNVVIAVAGLAKLFVGDLVEEALDIQNRMNEGNEPLKPHHIDFAYEAVREKGLLFHIKPRRNPFL
ncbi:Transcription initiation factor TFIID subunit 11 [Toxocara canis]|uniref:Transcription initiation factor TFIID subunit 11 n=1 Tax=Toxocara canis TaxID=6265 RepID=A0A0B2V970_TOXCA|nr:Transcription initiation factor TFIID subunit 11 [Toxocara canis]